MRALQAQPSMSCRLEHCRCVRTLPAASSSSLNYHKGWMGKELRAPQGDLHALATCKQSMSELCLHTAAALGTVLLPHIHCLQPAAACPERLPQEGVQNTGEATEWLPVSMLKGPMSQAAVGWALLVCCRLQLS